MEERTFDNAERHCVRAKPADGIAWVTGASSGIGRGVALELAKRGFQVAVTARRAEALQALGAASSGTIHAFPGDVTDEAGMAAIHAAIPRYRRADLSVSATAAAATIVSPPPEALVGADSDSIAKPRSLAV